MTASVTPSWRIDSILVAIASLDRSAFVRSWNASSITYIDPKFGALALSRSDCPAMATVWATPGSPPVFSSTRFITSRVCSAEVESGSRTLTSRYPLSCDGMKPVGVCVNP